MEFEYLEHTADVKFRAYGRTLEEAFENSAKAMFNCMVKLSSIKTKITKKFKISAESKESLLFDFLAELLVIHDSEGMLFSSFKVDISGDSLICEAKGEKISDHKTDIMIKAVTYHDMKISKKGKWTIQMVLDI